MSKEMRLFVGGVDSTHCLAWTHQTSYRFNLRQVVKAIVVLIIASCPSVAHCGANRWTTHGPNGGTILTLAIDPSNTSILYAGTSNGVFRSLDRAASWSEISGGLTFREILSLGIDSTNPTTLYLSTISGLFKSTNRGDSWTHINNVVPVGKRAIAIDPLNSSTLYVAAGGVFKSLDGGQTFVQSGSGITSQNITMIAIDPSSSLTLYAGDKSGGGLYKSTDAGASWSPAQNGLMVDAGFSDIGFNPSTPGILYVSSEGRGLFRSIDSGATWNRMTNGLSNLQVTSLAVDPLIPEILYAGLDPDTGAGEVFKSIDSGANWTRVLAAAVIKVIVVDSSSRVYAGQDGGDAIEMSSDSGGSWTRVNAGIYSAQINAIAVDPTNGSILYAGSRRGGIFKSTDHAQSWVKLRDGLQDDILSVGALLVSKFNHDTVYAGVSTPVGGIPLFKSTNGGATWTMASTGLPVNNSVQAIAMDNSNSSVVYVGSSGGGIFKSTNGGNSWVSANVGLPGSLLVTQIAVDNASPSIVYCATSAGVFKSVNGAVTWSSLGGGLPVSGTFWTITQDPVNSAVLYASTSSKAFRSSNSGNSWVEIPGGGNSIVEMVIDPSSPNRLYVATQFGIFKSLDSGQQWVPFNTGLPIGVSSDVVSLALDSQNPDSLYAAPAAGGLYERTQSEGYFTVAPCRIVDTRNPIGPFGGPALASGAVRTFVAVGQCGVPAEAIALSLNCTVVDPVGSGHVTVFPGNQSFPPVSTINFSRAQVRTNNTIVSLAGDGTGSFSGRALTDNGGNVHLVIDVTGYFE